MGKAALSKHVLQCHMTVKSVSTLVCLQHTLMCKACTPHMKNSTLNPERDGRWYGRWAMSAEQKPNFHRLMDTSKKTERRRRRKNHLTIQHCHLPTGCCCSSFNVGSVIIKPSCGASPCDIGQRWMCHSWQPAPNATALVNRTEWVASACY